MAFLKTARAVVQNPHVSRSAWGQIRDEGEVLPRRSRVASGTSNLVDQASAIFDSKFNPDDYLLTHATIVASVDVYQPTGAKVGSVFEDGFRVNRKYGDYRIAQQCQKFINNNRDAWSRDVLLKSFETFIGGHNFVEHVQIESMSKGRIIDAVARDIGDSVYIDILIATDRKHKDLVAAVESGKMATMSMGCTVDGTICTKCGHWAADETEMCAHIKYAKGNTFYDEQGRQHIIAELCGHKDLDPTGGVTFIEASWVETPAFTGAVLRNVMEASEEVSKQAAKVLNTPPPQWSGDAVVKAAGIERVATDVDTLEEAARNDCRVVAAISHGPLTSPDVLSVRRADEGSPFVADNFLAGWDDDESFDDEEGGGEEAPATEEESDFGKAKQDLKRHLVEQVVKQVKDELRKEDMSSALDSTAPNDTVQHEAAYTAGVDALVRTANSDVALLDSIAHLDMAIGKKIPLLIYRTALKLGSSSTYKDSHEFFRACHTLLGRQPKTAELRALARLSYLLSQRNSRWGNHNMAVAKEEE